MEDEREVTKQCLHICKDTRYHIKSVTNQESSLLQNGPQKAPEDEQKYFKAQTLTRQVLNKNRDSFAMIIGQLRHRLESLVLKNNPSDEKERSCLLGDIDISKQCLEVCKAASKVTSQKVYRVGEMIANGNSD